MCITCVIYISYNFDNYLLIFIEYFLDAWHRTNSFSSSVLHLNESHSLKIISFNMMRFVVEGM